MMTSHICNHLYRLESMSSEFCFLKNKASALKTMGLVYKQRFETKSSDLAKAEAEVRNQKHHIIFFFIFYSMGNMHYLFISQSCGEDAQRPSC